MAKKFYTEVDVQVLGGGFVVTLDGRTLKTPGKQALTFEAEFRAKLVAEEWHAQKEDILPDTMPCTRLMNVACELTPSKRPDLIAEFRKYCGTDLLCYRANSPSDLNERQENIWQPVLDWVAKKHGIHLVVTDSIRAVTQSEASLNAAAAYAQKLGHAELTLLVHFTASLGSAVLALALMERYLDMEAALEMSRLDELFQIERWGEDDEAQIRTRNIHIEMTALSALI